MHAALTAPTAGPPQRCPLEPTLAGAPAAAGAGVVLAGDRRRTCVLWPFLRPRAHLGRNVVRIALHRLSPSWARCTASIRARLAWTTTTPVDVVGPPHCCHRRTAHRDAPLHTLAAPCCDARLLCVMQTRCHAGTWASGLPARRNGQAA